MDSPVIEMIVNSGWESRIVLGILLIFSISTWAIVFNRIGFFRSMSGGNRRFRRRYEQIAAISDIDKIDAKHLHGPMGVLGKAAAGEYRRIMADISAHGEMRDRPFYVQNQLVMAGERLEGAYLSIVPTFDRGVFFLAMVSSLSPFLGLMGTVWGIMNSFFEIGKQGSASLPVVAPGIAEALVATLAGLVVAIPALFFYNYFNHRTERTENDLDEFRENLLARLKREVLAHAYLQERGAA